jgi:hypothetical protein
MVGFANVARKQGVLLYEAPYYRKNRSDALKTFANNADMAYAADAAALRDARFGNSNEYNVNMAVKNQRENMISTAADNNAKDPAQNVGVHGRLGLQLTRTGGALSRFQIPQVTRGKVNRGKGNRPARMNGAQGGAQGGAQSGVAAQVAPPQFATHVLGVPIPQVTPTTPVAPTAAYYSSPAAPTAGTAASYFFTHESHATPMSREMNVYNPPTHTPPSVPHAPLGRYRNISYAPGMAEMLGASRSTSGGMEHFSPSLTTPARRPSSGDGAGASGLTAPKKPSHISTRPSFKPTEPKAKRDLGLGGINAEILSSQKVQQGAFADWKGHALGRQDKKAAGRRLTYLQVWDAKLPEERRRWESMFRAGKNPNGSPKKASGVK